MTAFKQVLANLEQGQREEAQIGLEFVLRLDPTFVPATNLKRQLASSSKEIDLGDIIAQLQAPSTDAIDTLLIEAVDTFNARDFLAAKEKVEQVLRDLPGHQEARELRDQIDKALKIEGQVGQFLVQAREALAKGDAQEAANFVMMAQALDPHHTGIASTLKEIDETGGLAFSQTSVDRAAAPSGAAHARADAAVGVNTGQGDAPGQQAAQPGPAAGGLESAQNQDAFAVEFDTTNPFADLIGSPSAETSADQSADTGPSFGANEFTPMSDTSDLFSAPGDSGIPAESAVEPPDDTHEDGGVEKVKGLSPEDIGAAIEQLTARGQDAFDQDDHHQAISIWSQIYLHDPQHSGAVDLITQAKDHAAAVDSQLDRLLAEARDARDEGDVATASSLVSEALKVRPNHLAATLFAEELGAAAAATEPPRTEVDESEALGAAAPKLPELDDDLFGEAPEKIGEEGFEDEDDLDLDEYTFDDDFERVEGGSLIDRVRSRLSPKTVVIAAVGLIVVLAGVWMGSRFLSSEPEVDEAEAVTALLVQADRLAKANKVEEAIHLLREYPATGLFQQRIDMKIAKYEKMVGPAQPTPIPETALRAEDFLEQGLWWAAYASAADGLKAHPEDQGLLEIHQQVLEIEPEAQNLANALRYGDYRSAVGITEELLIRYPNQGDIVVVLERSLFNAALAEARTYNLTGAEKHLQRLLSLKPSDEEAARFLEFVQKYKVRGADIQLEIFVRNLSER